MTRKIAFFDIDGTLTSEIDGSVPQSAKAAIKAARENGHLMFINTGRCIQNVEERFRCVGFDGYVCGCGTNIYCIDRSSLSSEHVEETASSDFKQKDMKELLYIQQPHEVVMEILECSRQFLLDILFESKKEVRFDMNRTPNGLLTTGGLRQYRSFQSRNYDMSHDPEADDFTCDKFVVWFQDISDLPAFRKVSDRYFDCIDRGGQFREFVPIGYSKATGIQAVLDYYQLPLEQTYAFGDSNNDLSMLSYVPNSIAMGNASPKSLFQAVSFVTTNASRDGILEALLHFDFIHSGQC